MKTLKEIIENEDIQVFDCCHNAGAISSAIETTIKKHQLPVKFKRPISRHYQTAHGFDFRFSEIQSDNTKILYFDEDELFIAHVEDGVIYKDKFCSKWESPRLEIMLF